MRPWLIFPLMLVMLGVLAGCCAGRHPAQQAVSGAETAESPVQQTASGAQTWASGEVLPAPPEATEEQSQEEEETGVVQNQFYITAGDTTFTAEFADNSSAEALKELLGQGDLTLSMQDYGGFEKVGSLGSRLPQNNEQITTVPGDVILYQGSSITIYYNTNSWNFTRLGKIENVSQKELLAALGEGNVEVTFSLKGPAQ